MRPKIITPRPCKGCGSEFTPPAQRQRYCSRECVIEAQRKLRPIPCAVCGTTFTPPKSINKVCSLQCAHILAKGRARSPWQDRYWSKVNKTAPCWLWTGAPTSVGYGSFYIDAERTREYAHRIAWQLAHGAIPEGLYVCHNCPGGDNRLCVNPDHLFLGTHDDNMRDASVKGSVAHGERSGTAILTAALVHEIRDRYATGTTSHNQLAALFGVSASTIYHVIHRLTWKHVA